MKFTFSRNPFVRFSVWFDNNIAHAVKNYYYKNKKAHYTCCVCGEIIAPYFESTEEDQYNVLTDDYGWHKLDNGKYNRWICHHCADHGYAMSTDERELFEREYKWDEWQDIVEDGNKKVLAVIKEKDPEYYEYWFDDLESTSEAQEY